ncbi:hypothetical protein CEUSTIGMA_g5984.t1 [Chlamydomonas eustigma]|uniref:Uncharacterized protein n=1 Tax=Chlamydomonas eustigma TaxID=1157962 RepID=A0A250X639_9CHLO|nr:hypothetical protein CEUSTIGMA_g5984.t1 [Chlamydomonas eustigma]|eukprot:GAX78544.1 hypothetical protein CEUSTIGMA_g5984.t1 [Chlamydomonas eustigma]
MSGEDGASASPAPEWLTIGMHVEILGEEEGYAGSFSTAIVTEITESGRVTVEFDEFLEEDGVTKLKETFDFSSIFRIRPALPEETRLKSFKTVKTGHTVDYLEEDCWWVGVVKEVLSTRIKIILTEREEDLVTVANLDLMRTGHVWVPSELRWYRRRVTMSLLRQIGITGAPAQRAVEDMASQPLMFIDGTLAPSLEYSAPVPTTRSRRAEAGSARGGTGSRRKVKERARNWEGSSSGTEEEEEEEEEEVGDEKKGGGSDDADEGEEEGDVDWSARPRGRSKRANKARLVYVNGQPVLKENMYDLETGEPSVFDKELKKGDDALMSMPGVSYAPPSRAQGKGPDYLYHGARRAPGQAWSQVSDAKKDKSSSKAGRADGEPASTVRRTEHNDSVRRDREASEAARAIYLKHHIEKLKPFITSQVVKAIMDKASHAASALQDQVTPEPVQEQPSQITGTLREYQMMGLAWLVRCYDHGINAILADEMGLGKTLQTISFLAYLKFVRNVEGPHLVVVPLSVLPNWMAEFRKWCPEMRIVRLHVNDEGERKRLRQDVLGNPSSFDVAVTTYDMVHSQHFGEAIRNSVVWRYLILDEGHKVKNEETLVSQTMRRISKQHVLMLTGTPVQNNLRELYALLNFMYPDLFNEPTLFDSAFNLVKNTVDDSKLAQAHYLLRPFMLRRVKDEIEVRLPPRMETRINCPLSEMQTFWYRRLLLKESSFLVEMEAGGPTGPKRRGRKRKVQEEDEAQPSPSPAPPAAVAAAAEEHEATENGGDGGEGGEEGSNGAGKTWQKAMNLLMQLRKCCNHPFMFPDSEPDYDGSTTGEEIVEGSGKMKVLDRLLEKLKSRGHRVVLFSQFNIMLDVIEDYLIYRGYKYRRLDGSTNRIQRMIDIEVFNKPNSEVFIYILCTRAGGLGVNLQTADTCILYDSDWNPQWDLQAMARVHRIGQTRPVHVYRLCSEGTVEDRIQRRAEQKLYLDQMVNRGSTAAAEEMEALDKNELLSMLKFGADRIFKNDSGRMMSDAELEALLDRSTMLAEQELQTLKETQRDDAKQQQGQARVGSSSMGEAAAAAAAIKMEAAEEKLAAATAAAASNAAALKNEVKAEASAQEGSGGAAAASTTAKGSSVASTSAGSLQTAKHSALNFNAEEKPLSTFMLDGIDYKQLRELQTKGIRDIARDWVVKKRERKSRTTEVEVEGVGLVTVLNENNYSMQQGGISVAHKAKVKEPSTFGKKNRLQIAGRDYGHLDYCQVCWDGGNLLCCDYCPASMHPSCIGMTMQDAANVKKWACPHHTCCSCGRNTAAAGGLLFRCEACPNAFCEDCLPEDYQMVGECEHFKAMGQMHPKQACFILCGPPCKNQRETVEPLLQKVIEDAIALGQKKAVEAAIELERSIVEAAEIEAAENKQRLLRSQQAAAAAATPAVPEEYDVEDDGNTRKSGRQRQKQQRKQLEEELEDTGSPGGAGRRPSRNANKKQRLQSKPAKTAESTPIAATATGGGAATTSSAALAGSSFKSSAPNTQLPPTPAITLNSQAAAAASTEQQGAALQRAMAAIAAAVQFTAMQHVVAAAAAEQSNGVAGPSPPVLQLGVPPAVGTSTVVVRPQLSTAVQQQASANSNQATISTHPSVATALNVLTAQSSCQQTPPQQ